MTYEQVNQLLVTYMQTQNYAPDTQKKFKASLAYLCSFHNRYEDVENITAEEIQDFLTHLSSEKKLSPSTVNNYQAAIKFIVESIFNRKWPDEFAYFSLSKRKGLDPNLLPHFANPGTIFLS